MPRRCITEYDEYDGARVISVFKTVSVCPSVAHAAAFAQINRNDNNNTLRYYYAGT